jgi:hypothetical protein
MTSHFINCNIASFVSQVRRRDEEKKAIDGDGSLFPDCKSAPRINCAVEFRVARYFLVQHTKMRKKYTK